MAGLEIMIGHREVECPARGHRRAELLAEGTESKGTVTGWWKGLAGLMGEALSWLQQRSTNSRAGVMGPEHCAYVVGG